MGLARSSRAVCVRFAPTPVFARAYARRYHVWTTLAMRYQPDRFREPTVAKIFALNSSASMYIKTSQRLTTTTMSRLSQHGASVPSRLFVGKATSCSISAAVQCQWNHFHKAPSSNCVSSLFMQIVSVSNLLRRAKRMLLSTTFACSLRTWHTTTSAAKYLCQLPWESERVGLCMAD